MSEYDYSGLYKQDPNGTGQGAQQPSAPQAPQENTYPNVGSSGMNTANTARTDYTADAQPSGSAAGEQPAGSSFHSYSSASGPAAGGPGSPNGPQGPVGGPAPQPGPAPHRARKQGGGKKVALRIVAGVGVVVLGFGGGLLGTMAGNALGLGHDQVVIQQVQRDESAQTNQGSADGSEMTLVDIAAKVSPSVVAITTEQMVSTNVWFGSYIQSGAGSGVILSEDGRILTCAHVVDGATSITVQLSDDTEYPATVIGSDSSSDVAVLKIDATGLTPATIGDSNALAVGETVVAVGNPMGTLSGSVTDGIVSAVDRSVEVEGNAMSLIQTDAAISPGNSGGGLFNGKVELIGIVNASGSTTTSSGAVSQNLGFAIPISDAMDIATQLIENGYVARPALGVMILDINDAQTAYQYGVSNYGVYIIQVTPGGGADQAGLQAGDRIVSVDSNSVTTGQDLTSYLETKEIGDTVELQIEREGRMATYTVSLGESSANTGESAAG